jgi:YVTN family beta-propeller protein
MSLNDSSLKKFCIVIGFCLTVSAAYSQSESYIYVTNEDANTVSVISSLTNSVVATIPVGKRPRGIKVSPDGKLIYVALSGSPKCPPALSEEECAQRITDKSADGIAEVDVQANEVVRILTSGSDPEQFDVNWQTRRLYVSNEDMHQVSIIDMQQGNIVQSVATGREPEGVRLSPDGNLAYVTSEGDHEISVIDANSGERITRIPVGLRPRDVIFTADGSRAYVSAEFAASIMVIDVESHSVINEIGLTPGSLPMGLVLSRDESMLYVANGRGRTVAAIDLATAKEVALLEVGVRPWGLAMSLDGNTLYSANGPSDDVTVIDLDSFTIVTRIPVGETPWGAVAGPVPQ